jgi:hypothetical protein
MAHSKTNIAISTTVWVLLILLSVQLIWKFPKPLFFFYAGTFLALSLVFWIMRRGSPTRGLLQSYQVVLIWIIVTSLFLTGVYKVDHAGWNWQRVTGYNVTLPERHFKHIDFSIEKFLARYPFFTVAPDSSGLVLPKGIYDVQKTIVIPRNLPLRIEPGATLLFDVGRSLISYSPIYARGTKEEPIVFMAKNKLFKWGAVGVVHTEKSLFEYVIFRHGRQARVNDIDFLGGLSAIETDVEIRNCKFVNMFGKDALNVQHANVLITNNLFKNALRDGLDLDGGAGEVSYNQFINCRDEGIDISENLDDLQVFNNYIYDKRGGKLSAENHINEILSLNRLGYLKN